MPPRLCWFELNGPLPGPGYDNQLEKVERINGQIATFNNDMFATQHQLYEAVGNGTAGSRDRTPMFHSFGVKFTEEGREHKMKEWREELPAMKLHLSNRGRNKLARSAQNYFKHMFEPKFCTVPAWSQGVELESQPQNVQPLSPAESVPASAACDPASRDPAATATTTTLPADTTTPLPAETTTGDEAEPREAPLCQSFPEEPAVAAVTMMEQPTEDSEMMTDNTELGLETSTATPRGAPAVTDREPPKAKMSQARSQLNDWQIRFRKQKVCKKTVK